MDLTRLLLQHRQVTNADVINYIRKNKGRIIDKTLRIVRRGTERRPKFVIYLGSNWVETTATTIEEALQLRQMLWDEGNKNTPPQDGLGVQL